MRGGYYRGRIEISKPNLSQHRPNMKSIDKELHFNSESVIGPNFNPTVLRKQMTKQPSNAPKILKPQIIIILP